MPRSTWAALSAGTVMLVGIRGAHAQACADVSGNWVDGSGGAWSLNQQNPGGSITAAFSSAAISTCPATGGYGGSGSYSGSGGFHITVGLPGTPPAGCPRTINLTGTVKQPGCDHASISWTNDLGGIGVGSMTQACIVPPTPSETTVFKNWDLVHSAPTVSNFDATLNNPMPLHVPAFNFGGRKVQEIFWQNSVDACHFTGSRYVTFNAHAAGPFVMGSGDQNGYTDRVGIEDTNIILYYRAVGRVPCGFASYQKMEIDCSSGMQVYATNLLTNAIWDATVSNSRAGVGSGELKWGTTVQQYEAVGTAIINFLIGH